MKRFYLNRLIDESGVSGTGKVAYGICFNDGSVIMGWNTDTTSVALYRSIEDVDRIHGHNGKTVVEWTADVFDVWPDFIDANPLSLQYLLGASV